MLPKRRKDEIERTNQRRHDHSAPYRMRALASRLRSIGAPLLIVGDEKGPFAYELEGTELFTLEQQAKMPFKLAPLLPTGHYARKNLGYLEAIRRGFECIYETDDDNMPNDSWQVRRDLLRAGCHCSAVAQCISSVHR